MLQLSSRLFDKRVFNLLDAVHWTHGHHGSPTCDQQPNVSLFPIQTIWIIRVLIIIIITHSYLSVVYRAFTFFLLIFF